MPIIDDLKIVAEVEFAESPSLITSTKAHMKMRKCRLFL